MTKTDKEDGWKKLGRPRLKPGPKPKPPEPPTPSTRLIITDERPELPRPVEVATHENVPGDLLDREVLARFGVAEHLTAYRISDGQRRIIQQGRRL